MNIAYKNILDIRTIVWKRFFYTYTMYVGYTNIFSTPKGILISDIHCIRHAGYKNIVCNSQRCSYNRHPLYMYSSNSEKGGMAIAVPVPPALVGSVGMNELE